MEILGQENNISIEIYRETLVAFPFLVVNHNLKFLDSAR